LRVADGCVDAVGAVEKLMPKAISVPMARYAIIPEDEVGGRDRCRGMTRTVVPLRDTWMPKGTVARLYRAATSGMPPAFELG
jgi:hypothetical protein